MDGKDVKPEVSILNVSIKEDQDDNIDADTSIINLSDVKPAVSVLHDINKKEDEDQDEVESKDQDKAEGEDEEGHDGEGDDDEKEHKHIDALIFNQLRRKRKHSAEWVKSDREVQLIDTIFGNKEQLFENLEQSAGIGTKNEITERQPVWHDSGDEGVDISDVINFKKKGAPIFRKKGKYTTHLQGNFHKIIGTPEWAALDRQAEIDSDDEMLQTIGHIAKTTHSKLSQNTLRFKRLKDLNRATYAEGPGITCVVFHPTSSVGIVTGLSGVATIYSIDGLKNDKLHSMALKNFPIKTCHLSHDGTEAIMGGIKKFFYTYDLMTGATQRVFLPKDITKMAQFELSPCGKFIAIIGRFGEIHILNSVTKEIICTVKQEHPSTSLAFSIDSNKLFSHSSDAEICIFDLRAQRIQHRFIDEGCVNGSALQISPNGKLVASGSEQGVVNIYDYEATMESKMPQPIKTIFNLTTAITAIKFNYTSEMLAICSKDIKDAVKMVHFPSGTVFNNFPGSHANVGKPNVLAFSPQSGYLAIGNVSKEVPLYRLKHYCNY